MPSRIVRKFLLFPKTLNGVRRWLCFVCIRQDLVTWHDEDGTLNWWFLDKEFV